MKPSSAKLQMTLARAIAALWLAVGVVGLAWPGATPLIRGFGSDLLALVVVLCWSVLLGLPLGALAGSGPRWVDVGLRYTTDWLAAIPAVLLLAFVRPAGISLLGGLVLLGALRALEVGWVVRSALLRAAAADPTWAARSLGYMPLAVFLNRRLPAAIGPTLAHVAFTPLWLFLLDAVATAAGLGAASSERSLGALVAREGSSLAVITAAIAAVVGLTWALHRLGAYYGLRLAGKWQ